MSANDVATFGVSSGSKRKTWLLRALIFSGWILFSCLLSGYLTFPYDAIKEFLVYEVEHPRLAGGTERTRSSTSLSIAELEPHWFSGIALKNVTVMLGDAPARESDAEKQSAKPTTLSLSSFQARLQLLPLLLGKKTIAFSAEVAGGGTIEGTVTESSELSVLDVTLSEVELARLPISGGKIPYNFSGELNGTVLLELNKEAAENAGNIKLSLADFTLSEPKTDSNKKPFRAEAGSLELSCTIEKGICKFGPSTSKGKDLLLGLFGNLTFQRVYMEEAPLATLPNSLKATLLDIKARLEMTERFKQQPVAQGITMMLNMPIAAPYKSSDGAVQVRISGRGSLRLEPGANLRFPSK